MMLSLHQPQYLAGYPGYLAKIAASDLHVVLDNVAHEPHSFENRNRIRTKDSWAWLTVPLRHPVQVPIRDLRIADGNWQRKHWRTLQQNYRKAAHWDDYAPWLEAFYCQPWDDLLTLCLTQLTWTMQQLHLHTPLKLASELGVGGAKSDLILNLCRAAGANSYLSGPHGRDYLDLAAFARAGIAVEWHDYQHPVYRQAHPGFEFYMCSWDALLNMGVGARSLLEGEHDAD